MPRGVKIGKNIIEILTTGMYKDARVIVREFVQNSVDSLEKALGSGLYSDRQDLPPIKVLVDADTQTLMVTDAGLGVPNSDAWRVLTSIAASDKDRGKELGFRGIGRLAGLAYCSKMTIETSAPGEPLSSKLVWDAEKLRTLLHDRDYSLTAEEIVQQVTTFTTEQGESMDTGYYRVHLEGVTDESLLDSESIKQYLSQVAPIPFRSLFMFASKIREEFEAANSPLNEYRVYVNNEQIFKPYRSGLYEESTRGERERRIADIVDIRFERFEVDGKLTAICWYSIANPLQLIKICNPLGIRLRKGNIEVGDRFSLQSLFSDGRFHKYFVGELHVIDERCVPNGQRDYFEDTPVFRALESQFRQFALQLSRLCQQASQASSRLKDIEKFHREQEEFRKKDRERAFVGPEEREEATKRVAECREKAEDAEKELARFLSKSSDGKDDILSTLVAKQRKESLERIQSITVGNGGEEEDETGKGQKNHYLTGQLSNFTKKERKLIGRIYVIIKKVLPSAHADIVIAKIQEELGTNGKTETVSK
jgi:molecular chaperone HtpG